MSRRPFSLWIVLLCLALTACAQSKTPQLIASYPLNGSSAPPVQPPPAQPVYHTSLELEVGSVERAAQQARALTEKAGGYLSAWDAWTQNDEPRLRLVIEVPAPAFSALRADLLGLGTLAGENASSTWAPDGYGWGVYSEIVLTLRPKPSPWPDLPWPQPGWSGWNPLRTFQQAFGVSWGIFGFLVDIVIWVVVVAGPFVLLGLAVRWFVRKILRKFN